eukprot:GHVT01049213.1.p1 GENE.GHVT01049213.1~~GHVT01049213.1.p1  ORF type:complete len:551 (+),score=85.61 GHVT01049213.1:413-2065(+)
MPTPCAKSVGPGGGADDDIRVRAASAPFELATSLPPGSEASPYVYSIPAGSDYPISLYECPPLGYRESLPKLQAATQHRKAILTFIDDCYGLSASSCYPESPALLTKLKELKLRLVAANLAVDSSALSSTPSKQTLNEVAALDAASHFLLRTAFSVDRQKSEWFIKQESRLLAFKWAAFLVGRKTKMLFKGQGEHAGTRDPVDEVFTKEGLIYPQLVNPTKAHLAKEQLHLWNYAVRGHIDERIPDKFYIVPALTDAPSLVRTRQVYVYANCAFLKLEDMERVLLTKFRSFLNLAFSNFERKDMEAIRADPVLRAIVDDLPSCYLGQQFAENSSVDDADRLSPANLEAVYEKSFPPCMCRLFKFYKKSRHIRHGARQQLWLFLKGAGLTLEENLEVNKKMWDDPTQFDKNHRYNIRHIYGQEGNRTNYTPYACGKVIGLQPTSDEPLGCPFRQLNERDLQQMLVGYGLEGAEAQREIMANKRRNEFQGACRAFFAKRHPGHDGSGVGNHPNKFFEHSIKWNRGLAEGRVTETSRPQEQRGRRTSATPGLG